MRIWDIDPKLLCRKHLLGEHRELHAIWNILKHGKKGYINHPETKRWVGKLPALRTRHELLVEEMTRRGYVHETSLPEVSAGDKEQTELVNTLEEQMILLTGKDCDCPLDHPKF